MAKVCITKWETTENGLSYPECPNMKDWDERFNDGYCGNPKNNKSGIPIHCGTCNQSRIMAKYQCQFEKEMD